MIGVGHSSTSLTFSGSVATPYADMWLMHAFNKYRHAHRHTGRQRNKDATPTCRVVPWLVPGNGDGVKGVPASPTVTGSRGGACTWTVISSWFTGFLKE